jgi:hypothetical protein
MWLCCSVEQTIDFCVLPRRADAYAQFAVVQRFAQIAG